MAILGHASAIKVVSLMDPNASFDTKDWVNQIENYAEIQSRNTEVAEARMLVKLKADTERDLKQAEELKKI